MTASATATAFLRRAGGLAAILAVIAGILGMHVIAGNHSAHSAAATTVALTNAGSPADDAPTHQGPGAHPSHSAPAHHAADPAGAAVEPCSGSCTSGCPSAQTTTVSCTPSAQSGSLNAPLPGTTVFGAVPGSGPLDALLRAYSYLPGSPSPGELSISRT